MANGTTVKTCTRCAESKDQSEFYFRDGKPIARCKDCMRADTRDRYHADPDAAKARNAEWRKRNPDRVKYNAQKWYLENKDKALEYRAQWQRDNRDKVRESNRRSYSKYRDERLAAIESYRKSRPEWFREYNRLRSARRRARERDLSVVDFSNADLLARVEYYGGKCWICKTADFEHIDHVKPVSKGGGHILANLRPACASCNHSKSNKWPWPLRKAE